MGLLDNQQSRCTQNPDAIPKRIGVLTGGGDSPGLNAAIRAATLTAIRKYGMEVIGFVDGFNGLFDPENGARALSVDDVQGIEAIGGTILGTANRGNPFRMVVRDDDGHPVLGPDGKATTVDRSAEAVSRLKDLGIGGLLCIGGDGTLAMAREFYEKFGVPVVGVPKTIDFDLSGTEATFGFKTAVQVASEALDRLRTTADSHDRVLVLELMGRYAGWIALHAGLAGGAHAILLPELPYDPRAVWERVTNRFRRQRKFSLVVISEGARPVGGDYAVAEERAHPAGLPVLGGAGPRLRAELEALTEEERQRVLAEKGNPPEAPEIRVVVLGHIQRGGTPLADDRIIATACGSFAVDMVVRGLFGHMAAWTFEGPVAVRLDDATEPHLVDPDTDPLVQLARDIGICLGDSPDSPDED
ncbi:MAG: ATP-dependent 6-phosphofructokinase [Myxococcota bacterium]